MFVTGGCGFIGSNFIRKNINEHKITNIDKLTYAGNLKNLNGVNDSKNYTFFKKDICDKESMEKIMKGHDVVIHFAGETHVDRSIKSPEIFTKTNVFGTQNLLESARKNDIEKFIYISTDEVYGSISVGTAKECAPFRPSSPYSASKASADLLCQSYFKTYGLPIIITRPSNNFGPFQNKEKLIPHFVTNLYQNKKVPLYGSGKNLRNWIYVVDTCRAINFLIENGKNGEAYNVGGKNIKTNLTITRYILQHFHKSDRWIENVEDRPGHDFRYALSNVKMKKLGWNEEFRFLLALFQTIGWYENNEWWWKD